MNDKEFISALKDMDNDTLIDNLEDLGGDGYYQELRSAIIAEIRKRLVVPEREKKTDADIMKCARAMKKYCEKHRNEHDFYMCDTCEYSPSVRSAYAYSYGEKDKCPFNVPAYWDLPEGDKIE